MEFIDHWTKRKVDFKGHFSVELLPISPWAILAAFFIRLLVSLWIFRIWEKILHLTAHIWIQLLWSKIHVSSIKREKNKTWQMKNKVLTNKETICDFMRQKWTAGIGGGIRLKGETMWMAATWSYAGLSIKREGREGQCLSSLKEHYLIKTTSDWVRVRTDWEYERGVEGWRLASLFSCEWVSEWVDTEGENEPREWENNLAVPGVHMLTEGRRRNRRKKRL